LQCNVKKIKRKLMAIAAGLINHNWMQCGIGATEERSCDDSGTAIKAAPIEISRRITLSAAAPLADRQRCRHMDKYLAFE
jgi:hypothetical protein